MEIIRHRVNRLLELRSLDKSWGAEIDLRTRGSQIVLHHEPFADGDSFADFAAQWSGAGHQGTLILNPKEDGIEPQIQAILTANAITSYFLLDLTLPTQVKLTCRQKISKVAVRVSEYEPVEGALHFEGKAEWAWLDCFNGNPPPAETVRRLKGKFRLCLVSPELQGYAPSAIAAFKSLVPDCDAVCTKHPDLWS